MPNLNSNRPQLKRRAQLLLYSNVLSVSGGLLEIGLLRVLHHAVM